MATKSPKIPKEEPDRFLKMIQFQSWFFVGLLIIDVLFVIIKSLATSNGLFGALSDYTLLIGLLSVIGGGLSFGLGYQIQLNPERRRKLFLSYLISLIIVGVIAVLVLSAYQWN
ncbi:MAG: hypothetical protein JW776_02110 [Candidatus Lokiarchaeota archaeon]|nr:hypothetical protein [Candidatus Lokiarchaeota archaeon]